MPIKMTADRKHEAHVLVLDTVSAKLVDVPENFFDMPVGCRLVKKPEDVLTGGVTQLIEDFIR